MFPNPTNSLNGDGASYDLAVKGVDILRAQVSERHLSLAITATRRPVPYRVGPRPTARCAGLEPAATRPQTGFGRRSKHSGTYPRRRNISCTPGSLGPGRPQPEVHAGALFRPLRDAGPARLTHH